MRGKIKFLLSGCNCERNKATIEWVENLKETARSREERRTHEFFRRGWSWLKLMLINRYRFQNGDNYISYNIKRRNYMFSHRLFKSMLIGRRFGRRWSNFDWIKWEFLFRFDWKVIKILSCSVALFKHNSSSFCSRSGFNSFSLFRNYFTFSDSNLWGENNESCCWNECDVYLNWYINAVIFLL